MVRLGASVEENALATIEDIMGTPNRGAMGQEEMAQQPGYKPPRADIAKMRDVWNLYHSLQRADTGDEEFERAMAVKKEWEEKYELNDEESALVTNYQRLIQDKGMDPNAAFDQIVYTLTNYGDYVQNTTPWEHDYSQYKGDETAAKKFLGGALKKYEQQGWPRLFEVISRALDDAYRRDPSSYKLWPWMVKQIKASYDNWLKYWNKRTNFDYQSKMFTEIGASHILDITTEGGALLSKLRAENKLPQNFDINHMNVGDFEEWLMEWKKANREAEAQGRTVYEFHNGWTIQKLTTPEELQFEGDEMGHCVGGYAYHVEEGNTLIYSLRDDKGDPHVTIEMHAQEGYRDPSRDPEMSGYDNVEEALTENGIEGTDVPGEKNQFVHDYINPEHDPGEHTQRLRSYLDPEGGPDVKTDWGKSGEKPFEIVQIQGKGNMTPKPEYQHMIKEWLDALRAKGWKFIRSEDWYGNYDANDDDNEYSLSENTHDDWYGRGSNAAKARALDDWYDDHYKPNYQLYRGGEEMQDAYGLPRNAMQLNIGNSWDDILTDCIASLVEDYDHGRFRGNWENLAQAVWHAWQVEESYRHQTPEKLEAEARAFQKELEATDEKLIDWVDQMWWHAAEYQTDDLANNIRGEAEQEGKLEAIENKLDEIHGDGEWNDEDFSEYVRDEEPEIFEEAENKARYQVEDEYAGDAFKFLGYLNMLLGKTKLVPPSELPDPNQRHGGLPSYQDLIDAPWNGQEKKTPVEEGIEGTLSHWHEAGAATVAPAPVMPDLNYVLDYEPNEEQDTGWQAYAQWITSEPNWKDHTRRMNEDFQEMEWPESEFPKGTYSPAGITWKQAQDYLLCRCGGDGPCPQIAAAEPNKEFYARTESIEWVIKKVDASHFSSWHEAVVDIGACARCGNPIGSDGYCMACGQYNDEFHRPQRVPRGLPAQQSPWQPYQPAAETEKIPGTFANTEPPLDEVWRWRIPFTVIPGGEYEIGNPGESHSDSIGNNPKLDDFADELQQQGGEFGGEYQGIYMNHPTWGEVIHFPDRAETDPATEQKILDHARQIFQEHGPDIESKSLHWGRVASDDIQIFPIDKEHNLWFDEEGNERKRYRFNWAKNPETGKWGEGDTDWDSFLDQQGRQGQGYVAYHGDRPVASLTYMDDPAGWTMLGTAYTHPDYREQGLFNRLAQPLRDTGRPIDAYVWNNPWLKNKVRSWR